METNEMEPKPEFTVKIPKPPKWSVVTSGVLATIAALMALNNFQSNRINNRPRAVLWQTGERQEGWKPVTTSFENKVYTLGVTDDGFVVAKPLLNVPPPPPPSLPPMVPATPNTNQTNLNLKR